MRKVPLQTFEPAPAASIIREIETAACIVVFTTKKSERVSLENHRSGVLSMRIFYCWRSACVDLTPGA